MRPNSQPMPSAIKALMYGWVSIYREASLLARDEQRCRTCGEAGFVADDNDDNEEEVIKHHGCAICELAPSILTGPMGHSVSRRYPNFLELACAFIAATALLIMASAAAQAPSESTANNIFEVQRALASCVAPLVKEPHQEIRITARVGFNARGQPLGPPHFTYVTPDVSDDIKDEYKNAVSEALQRCTPLSFSPELGGSIAGVPLISNLRRTRSSTN